MSEHLQTILVSMLGAVLLAVLTDVLKSFAIARAAKRDAVKKDLSIAAQDETLLHIKELVNSRMTDTVRRLDTALDKLATLESAVDTLVPKQKKLVQDAVKDAETANHT